MSCPSSSGAMNCFEIRNCVGGALGAIAGVAPRGSLPPTVGVAGAKPNQDRLDHLIVAKCRAKGIHQRHGHPINLSRLILKTGLLRVPAVMAGGQMIP